MTEHAGVEGTGGPGPGPAPRKAERRAPMALAVLVAGAVYFLIPEGFRISEATRIAYPAALLLLLSALVVADPGRIDRDSPWLRVGTGILLSVITLASGGSTVRLVVGILQKAAFATPTELLTIGLVIWVTNVIAFALWYWHLDRGGPAARAADRGDAVPAFHFPEEDLPFLQERGWYPQFVDYLALSFNTSTAFGSADVSAVRHWSKLWLMAEAGVSLTIVALVVARAVNIL